MHWSKCVGNLMAFKVVKPGTSPAVQWLRLCTSTAGGTGSIPGWGTKILHAARCGCNKKLPNLSALCDSGAQVNAVPRIPHQHSQKVTLDVETNL